MSYGYLVIAIISEVIGTLALKASNGFTQVLPSTLCIISYIAAFYFLSLVLKHISVGIAYAIWAGAGVVLVSAFSAIIYKQIPDMAALIGMAFIIVGIVIINLFSQSVGH